MDNDWKELIGDFLEEAYSLLDSLEGSLLHLEKDPTDKSGIDVVFRVAHTIKGGAGAVGFSDVTKLTHIMEDVLDLVRQGKYVFNNNDISLLLEIKDELTILLQAHEQGSPSSSEKTEELVTALEKIKQQVLTQLSSKQASEQYNESDDYSIDHLPIAARFDLNSELLFSIQEALNEGESLLFIEIRFNEDYELKEVAPFEILNIINNIAEPIIMNPSPEHLDEEYIPFLNVVISSDEDPNYIQQKLSLSDVTTKVTVTALSTELYISLENSMSGVSIDTDTPIAPEENSIIAQEVVSIVDLPKTTEILQDPSDSSKENISKDKDITSKQEEKRSLTLKVESSRIDELLNLLGELVIIRSGLNQFGAELEKSVYNTGLNLRTFLASDTLFPLHEDPEINKTRNGQFKSDFSLITSSVEHYIEYIQQLARISSSLQIKMMNLRMVPMQTVFSRFTRLTRDIAKQLDKKIELIIEGGETEIDKGMIDDLYDPLMHMIRNSLDHGIESPQERVAVGKDETGTIQLKAYQEGDAIFIEITDDGKGIDGTKIAEKAFAKEFITATQLANLSDQEKLSLIFLPGFSTIDQISNLSGRGVGMDVVNKNIQELGGSVSINSKVGYGTTIRIQLPLTLAIIQGLLILIEKVHYVIPITSVEETIILNNSMIYKLEHYYTVKFREKLIPLISLSSVLYNINPLSDPQEDGASTPDNQKSLHDTIEVKDFHHQYCIVVRYSNRQVGIIVPEILKEQDIVVKPLDNRLISSPGISAATIVGNGEVGFILDLPQVIRYYLKNQK